MNYDEKSDFKAAPIREDQGSRIESDVTFRVLNYAELHNHPPALFNSAVARLICKDSEELHPSRKFINLRRCNLRPVDFLFHSTPTST